MSSDLFLTVSAVGTNLHALPNDGADFGPDTPGTTTSGIQEGLNALAAAGGGTLFFRQGVYQLSSPLYGTGSDQTIWVSPGSTIRFANTTTPLSSGTNFPAMFISIGSSITQTGTYTNYSHVHWYGNGSIVDLNGAGLSSGSTPTLFGIVQVGEANTSTPPAAGEDIIVDGFVLVNVAYAAIYISVENYISSVPYANQIRNVIISRIYASWSGSSTGAYGLAIQGSAREIAIEDCIFDASSGGLSGATSYSNCFISANSGDTSSVAVRRCTFIQAPGSSGVGSGNVFELQGNTSPYSSSSTRYCTDITFEDTIFDSGGTSTGQLSGFGGGLIDDTGTSSSVGYVSNVEFKRCQFVNCGVSFQAYGLYFGYLRFCDGSIPQAFSTATLTGRGPADIGQALTGLANTTYTNLDGFDEDWVLNGGVGGTISINGTNTALANGVFRVRVGDQIKLSAYTTLPSGYKQAR